MATTWYNGIVKKIAEQAPNVRTFHVQVPELPSLPFEAGQFITLDLPIGEKRLQRWRSYSIANAPDGRNVLELCVVRSEAGLGTRYLFEDIREGSVLKFKGPEGGFILPETIDKDLVFICTGTGIAPFRSMILDIMHQHKAHRSIHLIFGAREESGILYRADFEALAQNSPLFKYDIVLSKQPEWPGWKGHIHQVYLTEYPKPRADIAFYLCGWSNMVDEAMVNLMQKLGYDRAQIHFELYG